MKEEARIEVYGHTSNSFSFFFLFLQFVNTKNSMLRKNSRYCYRSKRCISTDSNRIRVYKKVTVTYAILSCAGLRIKKMYDLDKVRAFRRFNEWYFWITCKVKWFIAYDVVHMITKVVTELELRMHEPCDWEIHSSVRWLDFIYKSFFIYLYRIQYHVVSWHIHTDFIRIIETQFLEILQSIPMQF